MALNFGNFIRTTLRSPATPSDTTLLLAAGDGALFNIPSGDHFYVVVNDSTTVEVMKYVSTGVPANDTIGVIRAQDGTTAKSFPAGSCVQVAWNKLQVSEYITVIYNQLFDAALLGVNTIEVDETPTTTPEGGVIYAVRVDTHQYWYWDASEAEWVEIGSIGQGIIVVTSTPVNPPDPNVRFAVNTADNTLYYWNNIEWLLIAGGSGDSGEEVWTRRTTASVVMTPGQTLTSSGFTWTDNVRWQANDALSSIISVNGSGQYTFSHDALLEMMVGMNAEVGTPVANCAGSLVLTNTEDGLAFWGDSFDFDAGQSQNAVLLSAQTSPFKVTAGKVMDLNIIYDSSSSGNLTINRIYSSIRVITLL